MSHKLLVVTYHDDLSQFEMFCYCLNKNWKSDQRLTVVVSKDTSVETVQKIVDRYLHTWAVDIQATAYPYSNGYTEQQVNKIVYSLDTSVEDVIVFDSKDFLLRPSSIADFKQSNQYRVTFYVPGQQLVDLCPDIKQVVDSDVGNLPSVLNLTPWIWNVKELDDYWQYINQRFGDYRAWKEFPAGTEIYGFYVYTWCNQQTTILWQQPEHTPLLVGGGWTHQTYRGMLEEANAFDQWTERIVWKHSRKLEDPRCLEVTKSVLLNYDIQQEIIDRVFCYEEPGKP